MDDTVNILVVEDDIALAMLMASLLTRAGINVHVAHNDEQAVQKLQQTTFDLITLDIDLSGANGFSLYQRLQQLPGWQETPVVFVSGRHGEEDRLRALELGAVDYVTKPFQPLDFIRRIQSHVEEPTVA